MLTRVDVELGARAYPVLIGAGCLASLGETLRAHQIQHTNAFLLTNPQVGALYGQTAAESLERAGFKKVVRHEIPSTEEGKNWDEFSKTCAALLEHFPDAGAAPLVVLLGVGWLAIWAGLRLRYTVGACRLCRSRPLCFQRWIPAWAGKWR